MYLRDSLSLIFSRVPAPNRTSRRSPTRRLRLEPLDDRALPSSVTLAPSEPAPQLVGERVTWTATAVDVGANPVYQFQIGRASCRERVEHAAGAGAVKKEAQVSTNG